MYTAQIRLQYSGTYYIITLQMFLFKVKCNVSFDIPILLYYIVMHFNIKV